MAVITDRTNQFVGGAADGIWRWRDLSSITPSGAAALSQVTGEARFTNADSTGLWIIGHGVKHASGGSSASPGQVFPIGAAFLTANPKMKFKLGAVFAVNGTAIPNTVTINVGFYPVTASGGSGALVYTLNTTGSVVEAYTAGISANTIFGQDNPDRRSAFVSGGDQNYALGVQLVNALPSGCVVDISAALLVTPF